MLPNQLPQVLYRYFSLNGMVHIPGLGQLNLCRIPAINDFIGKKILPFSYVIRYDRWEDKMPADQLKYIQKHAGLETDQLLSSLKMLEDEMKSKLHAEGKIEWQGLGSFIVNENGDILFHQKNHVTVTHTDVRYKHVLREKVDHPVIVGEQEKTLAEMEEYFDEKTNRTFFKDWKLGALILILLIISILSARFLIGNYSVFEPTLSPLHPVKPSELHILMK
jgi:nucleoid DNA-binding protein